VNTFRTWGTFWEPDVNALGTHWEHTPPPPPPPPLLTIPIGCMNILFAKLFVTIFNLD